MKKLLSFAILSIALVGAVFAQHPRTYVLELSDAAKSIELPKNQYADNYQSNPNVDCTEYWKGDLPKAGDTIEVHYKFTSDIDIPALSANIVDTSPKANYWTTLTGKDNHELPLFQKDVKAGQTYEGVWSVTLAKDTLAKITVVLMYDDPNLIKTFGVSKAAAAAKLTVASAGAATTKVAPKVQRKAKTWKVDLSKYAAFFKIEADHPWVNGAPDTKVITGWQATLDMLQVFGDDLPIKGDTIVVSFKGTSDTDIPLLKSLLIDNSPDANWWTILTEEETDEAFPFAKDIVAGKPFKGSVTFKVNKDSKGGCTIALRASVDAMEHPATFKATK